MKCALASLGFINENIQYNKNVIINTMIRCAADTDIILFGEAFLQGFYGATFDPAHDAQLALSPDDAIIHDIRTAAKQHGVAVSFGFIEKDGPLFYSSQITIGSDGIREVHHEFVDTAHLTEGKNIKEFVYEWK